MSTDISALVARLHNAAQRATSEAHAIEDPSTRRAICELADALQDLASHLKDSE